MSLCGPTVSHKSYFTVFVMSRRKECFERSDGKETNIIHFFSNDLLSPLMHVRKVVSGLEKKSCERARKYADASQAAMI